MKKKVLIATAAAVTVLASLLLFSAVYAQSGTGYPSEDDVNRVAKKLYCPVCPNTPLDVCETQACKDWRGQIKDQLASGWTDQQAISYFVTQYGERVLAEPQRRGFTSLVWALPVIAVLLGSVLVWQLLKSWRRKQAHLPGPAASQPQVAPEILSRIEQEVRELD